MKNCSTGVVEYWTTLSVARHGGRLILIGRLGHDQLRLDAVQSSRVATEHFFLNLLGNFPFVHVIDRLSNVGSVEVGHVRRSQVDIFIEIPKSKRYFLIALKSDVTALVENLVRIANFFSQMPV